MSDACKHPRPYWDDDDPGLLHCDDCQRTWRLDGDSWVRDKLRIFWWRRVTANV